MTIQLEVWLKPKLLKQMVILNDTTSNANVPEFSVSELSNAIKRSLEQGFSHVRVRAECGRVTIAKSGHIYLDLKDKDAIISGIIWAGVARSLQTKPEEGLEVIAIGKITTFPGQSKYQIIIEKLELAGQGAILLQLEERRKKLLAEGLFDPEKKQAIPFLPRTIGVVTSPTGAVIRDILHRLSDRFPVHVIVWRVLVQGEKAASQVAQAIVGFNAIDGKGDVPRPDLIIVARGGGSIEDLWAFNEEIVVRAAAASDIPLISAIGHETDTTLIDFASDLRAPTPTGAAEKAVPVRNDLLASLASINGRLSSALYRKLDAAKLQNRAIIAALPRPENIFANRRQALDIIDLKFLPALQIILRNAQHEFSKIAGRMQPHILIGDLNIKRNVLQNLDERRKSAMARVIKDEKTQSLANQQKLGQAWGRVQTAWIFGFEWRKSQLKLSEKMLGSLDYNNVLKRGFAIVKKHETVLKSKAALTEAKNFTIIVQDGEIDAQIASAKLIQGSLF
ncbi:MAG: exodeoxyribonuclease VII large subunit [Pseudomonadota bacterium]